MKRIKSLNAAPDSAIISHKGRPWNLQTFKLKIVARPRRPSTLEHLTINFKSINIAGHIDYLQNTLPLFHASRRLYGSRFNFWQAVDDPLLMTPPSLPSCASPLTHRHHVNYMITMNSIDELPDPL